MKFRLGRWAILSFTLALWAQAVPVPVQPVTAPHGMVVAAHPEAAEIGARILREGGNAMDAAVAVSLAVGVAEPYGSGMGGKLMLLYFDAASGQAFAVDGMDESSRSLDPEMFRAWGETKRNYGWTSVAVPGLPAALHEAHRRWGSRPWADNIAPVIDLARQGFTVLPKTRELFEERLEKLQAAEDAFQQLFLPGGELPDVGQRLPNEALARTMETYAREGADGFYRGPVAEAIVTASARAGGYLTLDDFAAYRARISSPIGIDFRGFQVLSGPPPTSGGSLHLAILKALESEEISAPLRSAENIDLIGRVWREVLPLVQRRIADSPDSRDAFESLVTPESITAVRKRAAAAQRERRVAIHIAEPESVHASTTHFAVVDRHGNVVCATQSQSLHFGACVAVGGVVMNNSMSNFSLSDPRNPNFIAPGRRPRSTIAPTLVLRDGRPVLAIGIPGASRIPTAVLQSVLDFLVLDRPLEEAIGDTRVHWHNPLQRGRPDAIEAENTLPRDVVAELRERGWDVTLRETPGTGRHFGGLNAITLNPDGTRTGYADPRRTNAAVGH